AVARWPGSCSSTRRSSSRTTSSTIHSSRTTACWRARGWRRARGRTSRCTMRSRCRTRDGTIDRRGGSASAAPPTASSASLPRDRYDVVVVGAPVFLRIENAHAETRELIGTLRERFPRSVLLLADGYVGGQHYADYDADGVLAQYPELDVILKYPGERFFA